MTPSAAPAIILMVRGRSLLARAERATRIAANIVSADADLAPLNRSIDTSAAGNGSQAANFLAVGAAVSARNVRSVTGRTRWNFQAVGKSMPREARTCAAERPPTAPMVSERESKLLNAQDQIMM